MTIDFTFSQEVEDARLMMREFLHNTVKKEFDALSAKGVPPEAARARRNASILEITSCVRAATLLDLGITIVSF